MASAPAWSETSELKSPEVKPPRTLALGLSYLGVQVRYFFVPKWAGEVKYQFGTVNSDGGNTTSQVIGLRGYRFFDTGTAYRLYLGGEASAVNSRDKQDGVFYRATGTALGAFGGFEYTISKHWTLGLDIGPYLFSLKNNVVGGSDASLDFVANGAVSYYFR